MNKQGRGVVSAWGNCEYGKLGQGDDDLGDHLTPVKVEGEGGVGFLSNIVAISAGNHHVLALEKPELGGKVWAWGKSEFGQLGNGQSGLGAKKTTPVQVMIDEETPLADIVYIDAGFEHSIAIDKDGNVWVWGWNLYGQLGLGHNSPLYHLEKIPKRMPKTK